jgi:hypothetical protein
MFTIVAVFQVPEGYVKIDNDCFLQSISDSLAILSHAKQRTDFPASNMKTNSVVLVRKRTIPTERSQHVGEVSANFSW